MAKPIDVNYTIRDAKGELSTVTVHIPSTTTAVNAVAFARTLAPLVGTMVDGSLVRVTVAFNIAPSGLGFPALPGAVSDVQEKAYFAYRGVNGFLKSLTIPTIKETLFAAGSKLLDLANPAVSAFNSAMTGGLDVSGEGGTGTITPTDYRGDDLVDIEEAREDWGAYRP